MIDIYSHLTIKMEKSGETGSEDLILRKLNKNNNNNCQQPEQEQTSSKLLNRKTGETHISFHFMVELSLESSLQMHQNEALEVSKLQNGGFRRRF